MVAPVHRTRSHAVGPSGPAGHRGLRRTDRAAWRGDLRGPVTGRSVRTGPPRISTPRARRYLTAGPLASERAAGGTNRHGQRVGRETCRSATTRSRPARPGCSWPSSGRVSTADAACCASASTCAAGTRRSGGVHWQPAVVARQVWARCWAYRCRGCDAGGRVSVVASVDRLGRGGAAAVLSIPCVAK